MYIEYLKLFFVEIYVVGIRFEILKESIVKNEEILLGKMLLELSKEKGGDILFNCLEEVFKVIYNYFFLGKLYMFLNVCLG